MLHVLVFGTPTAQNVVCAFQLCRCGTKANASYARLCSYSYRQWEKICLLHRVFSCPKTPLVRSASFWLLPHSIRVYSWLLCVDTVQCMLVCRPKELQIRFSLLSRYLVFSSTKCCRTQRERKIELQQKQGKISRPLFFLQFTRKKNTFTTPRNKYSNSAQECCRIYCIHIGCSYIMCQLPTG